MRMKRKWTTSAALTIVPLLLAGCSEVSRQDVSDAREAVREEKRETQETREKAAEKIREEERETEEARHEALKPSIDDERKLDKVREEERETQEAREAARKEIQEEEDETREAEAEARDTEAKFNAQQARDAYVAQVESKLDAADKRIETLEDQGDELEGPAKEENERQIDELQTRRQRTADALGDLKSAEVLQWQESRDEVERALNDLSQEMEESM